MVGKTKSFWLNLTVGLLALGGLVVSARAALQFDVFLGYDGLVPEASWFPIVCEVKNDGPSFKGTVEVGTGNVNSGQSRRVVVELPTGTLKRFVIPVFSGTRGNGLWDVRLYDGRGKLRAEQANLLARKQPSRGVPLIGALPRTPGGTPVLRQIQAPASETPPTAARLLPAIFPDNPLVLEGLDCLYLNSERASELSVSQVNAIFAWVNAGGHLVIGVEQPSDVNSSPWLKDLFPGQVKDLQTIHEHPELQAWLRSATWTPPAPEVMERPRIPNGFRRPPRPNPRPEPAVQSPYAGLTDDLRFETADLQVAVSDLREGQVLVAAGDTPLIVRARRGCGCVTALLFSPEREPLRSWKNLPSFWSRLADVPGGYYLSSDFNRPGGLSSDGIFGAMLDTRQVHKLPLEWLLLLLVVYLVVIGPLDQYWLKRIGKPMLTWITFPCYVVLFSLVIYFIGYRLRAGESEWNELHVVDVLANGERAELRGRTYASVYSPANERYLLQSQQKYATLRGEFAGWSAGGQSSERATIVQNGDSFKADIFVPVWTSQLFVSDWWQSEDVPLSLSVQALGDNYQVKVENHTGCKLTNLQLVLADRLVSLGDLAAAEAKTYPIKKEQGTPLRDYVRTYGEVFQGTVRSREHAFGGAESGRLADLPNSAVAASFLSQLGGERNYVNNEFIAPPGLDLSAVVEHGNAVLLAWAGDYSPVKPIYQFTPRRTHRNTLWRVAAPLP